jgi:hypothetical protein
VHERFSISIGMTAIVAVLFASGASVGVPTNARADDYLVAPKTSAPETGHWYYRTDRATRRKCWYLRADQSSQPAARLATADAAPAASEPKSAMWQHHPTPVSDQELEQDKTKCENKGNTGPVGAGSPEFKLFLVFSECMRAAGYQPILSAQ